MATDKALCKGRCFQTVSVAIFFINKQAPTLLSLGKESENGTKEIPIIEERHFTFEQKSKTKPVMLYEYHENQKWKTEYHLYSTL